MGPESVEALRVWMNYREDFYGLINEPDSYVYCAINNYPSVEGRDEIKVGDQVLPTAFSRMMRYERRRAGIKKPISPHSLRKTHSTNLTGGGVPERWVNVMQGKKGKGTQGTYQRPNKEELIEVYQKAYHTLSLEDLVVGEKVSKLNRLVEEQDATIQNLKTQLEDIQKLLLSNIQKPDDETEYRIESFASGMEVDPDIINSFQDPDWWIKKILSNPDDHEEWLVKEALDALKAKQVEK
jgi:hypothetical protein